MAFILYFSWVIQSDCEIVQSENNHSAVLRKKLFEWFIKVNQKRNKLLH